MAPFATMKSLRCCFGYLHEQQPKPVQITRIQRNESASSFVDYIDDDDDRSTLPPCPDSDDEDAEPLPAPDWMSMSPGEDIRSFVEDCTQDQNSVPFDYEACYGTLSALRVSAYQIIQQNPDAMALRSFLGLWLACSAAVRCLDRRGKNGVIRTLADDITLRVNEFTRVCDGLPYLTAAIMYRVESVEWLLSVVRFVATVLAHAFTENSQSFTDTVRSAYTVILATNATRRRILTAKFSLRFVDSRDSFVNKISDNYYVVVSLHTKIKRLNKHSPLTLSEGKYQCVFADGAVDEDTDAPSTPVVYDASRQAYMINGGDVTPRSRSDSNMQDQINVIEALNTSHENVRKLNNPSITPRPSTSTPTPAPSVQVSASTEEKENGTMNRHQKRAEMARARFQSRKKPNSEQQIRRKTRNLTPDVAAKRKSKSENGVPKIDMRAVDLARKRCDDAYHPLRYDAEQRIRNSAVILFVEKCAADLTAVYKLTVPIVAKYKERMML